MSIKKKIKVLSLTVLGIEAEPWDDLWDRVEDLTDAFGTDAVCEAFEEWAKTRRGEMLARPVGEFLKFAPGLIQGIINLKENQEVKALIGDMVFHTNGDITFDREQQTAIGRLMAVNDPKDIKAAFAEYYGQVENDGFLLKRAAQDFVEKAEQLLTLQKRRKAEHVAQESLKTQLIAQERLIAEKHLSERAAKDAEEALQADVGLPE